MVPTSFLTFFAASAGAGAALIGLLFVAISISPERIFRSDKPEQQTVAMSAFTALVNAFFISLGALIPQVFIAWVVAALAFFGVSNTLNMGARLFLRRGGSSWTTVLRRAVLVIVSLVIYGYEAYVAIRLIEAPNTNTTEWVQVIAVLTMAVYGLGLTRAWELLGAPRYTLLSWLSPMHDLNRDAEIGAEGAAVEAATAPATVAKVEASSEHPAGR
jgi:hypothetical protein